jgi:hypothetical protein
MSDFLDIRQVMLDYSLRVIVVTGFSLKRDLINILVRNGFFVVDSRYKYQPILDYKMIAEGQYGTYRDIRDYYNYLEGIPFAVYKNSRHYKRNNAIDVVNILELQQKKAVCVFTKASILHNYNVENVGILPSSCSDQGIVVYVYPPLVSYSKIQLMRRSRDFMRQRYVYLITGVTWSEIDRLAEKCGLHYSFNIPKRCKGSFDTYEKYKGLRDFYYEMKQRPFDDEFLIGIVERNIMQAKNREAMMMSIMINWNTDMAYPWMRAWFNGNYSLKDFLDLLECTNIELDRLVQFCRTSIDIRELIDRQSRIGFKDTSLERYYRNKFKQVLL